MAAIRVTSAFQAVPIAVLAVLEGWLLLDLLSAADRRGVAIFGLLWSAGIALFVGSAIVHWRVARWGGLLVLGGTYVGLHAFLLGVQLTAAVTFLALLIAHVELRILAVRFTPLFARTLTPTDRRRIGGALARALVRLTITLGLAIVLPLVAADLSSIGVVPVTSIPTAFLLAGALVAVVALLALFPVWEQRVR